MDKLKLVTDESSPIRLGSKDIITVNENEIETPISIKGLIRCSDLDNILKSRGWNQIGTKFIKNNKVNVNTRLSDGIIDSIDSNSFPLDMEKQKSIDILSTEYNNLFGDGILKPNELLRSTNILLDGLKYINLINYKSDIYTNILNIDDISKFNCSKDSDCVLSISIRYNKGGNIYAKDTYMQPFIVDGEDLKTIDLTETINNDVVVECINNIIRVLPINKNVIECIISDCSLIYGN